MRRRARGWTNLAWSASCLALGQLILAVGVDQFAPGTRDPEFAAIRNRLAQRQAEAPDRPLVLALGSSRTQFGLRTGWLNNPTDARAPLVFNFGVPGSGPLMEDVVLRRLLADGVRPAVAFLEVLPGFMTCQDGGSPMEERMMHPERLQASEVLRLAGLAHSLPRLLKPWATARLLPVYHYNGQLRDCLRFQSPREDEKQRQTDPYGWRGYPDPRNRQSLDDNIRLLQQEAAACRTREPAWGSLHALRDMLELCQERGIQAALVLPPEPTGCRPFYRAHGLGVLLEQVHTLARTFDVPLYDARDWVGDEWFLDSLHMGATGAGLYTKRFARDALGPELHRLALARSWER